MILDVFSDASQRGDLFAGAYMIGADGPYGLRWEMCKTSTETELRMSAYALWEARAFLGTYETRTGSSSHRARRRSSSGER